MTAATDYSGIEGAVFVDINYQVARTALGGRAVEERNGMGMVCDGSMRNYSVPSQPRIMVPNRHVSSSRRNNATIPCRSKK